MFSFVIPLIICIIIFTFTAFFTPKRISKYETYATVFFALFLTQLIDMVLDVQFDLFGYGLKGADFWGIAAEITLNPLGAVLMMNFYPFNSNVIRKILYVFLCSIGCVIFECLSIKLGFFYHNGWKLWHSALCYPILIHVLAKNIYFIRKIIP